MQGHIKLVIMVIEISGVNFWVWELGIGIGNGAWG